MITNDKELVDNWTLRFDEISNNVYKVQLTDNFGRQAITTDHDFYHWRKCSAIAGHSCLLVKPVFNWNSLR